MDIRKPKPWHGWREFLNECVIIVVGVLIALSAEQGVEWLHWRHQVQVTREKLSVELATQFARGEVRVASGRCVESRLDDLAGFVDEAERTGVLRPVGEPGYPPYSLLIKGAWTSATSAQITAHLPSDELRSYSGAYGFLSVFEGLELRETEVWTTLYGLVGPGRRFAPSDAATYRQAISEARYLDRFIGLHAVRARQMADAGRVAYDRERLQKDFASLMADVNQRPICQPMTSPPPAHYGAAPFATVVEVARTHPYTAEAIGLK